MVFKTESIIETLENVLNKEINKININDLEKITYLRINKISIDDVLIVDISDLQYFPNVEEISIENCMVDFKFIETLMKNKIIRKISQFNGYVGYIGKNNSIYYDSKFEMENLNIIR